MSSEPQPDVGLQIAHVLFIDVVGYSKLRVNRQSDLLQRLNQLVRGTEQFRRAEAAGKLVRLPTGDGMALAFFTSPDAPVRCAREISAALRTQPDVRLRMGIHSGPVDAVSDVNDRSNVAGAGINMAQRVMDCGDAGHILLSQRVADDLSQYEEWEPYLHDLGEFEVKHGVRIGVVNFSGDGIGNPVAPEKLRRLTSLRKGRQRRRLIVWMLVALLVIGGLGLIVWFQRARIAGGISLATNLSEKGIAVLPLENLSEDKENAFFADGIQDDILTALEKIADLRVISRSSVMQYRGGTRNFREIAQALGVAHLLEGSVRRVANRVLVNVQLIDARTDRHIWAERYDKTLADSIALQGEIATEIAAALRAKLAPAEKERLSTQPTTNPKAYALYLEAREKERTGASKEDAFAIDELYGQATALDPNFALALARQSMWNCIMYQVGRRAENKIKARGLALEALRLAPDLGEAHLAQGIWLLRAESDYDAALKEFAIASQTLPNNPEILGQLAVIYRRQGRWREALVKFQHIAELDPRSADVFSDVALVDAALRDWAGVKAQYQRALEITPNDFRMMARFASLVMFGEGDLAAARAILQKVPEFMHDASGRPTDEFTVVRWELCMLERNFAAAQKLLVEFPSEEFNEPAVGMKSFALGCTAFAQGDLITARPLFEKARSHYQSYAETHPDDPVYLAPLGLMDAYLGRKEDALRESRRAVELLPESKDAANGPGYSANLALVYALTGETEQALTLLERLLTTPSANVTLAELRLSWKWDSLRKELRFQKILAAPEPKTIY
ncbi:MAG: tetratricopeptide repeat protein [Verrucomicrobiota bacterium]|nr:tetratricopeptide repeat protein [Verrucomicrobiota bacterium]